MVVIGWCRRWRRVAAFDASMRKKEGFVLPSQCSEGCFPYVMKCPTPCEDASFRPLSSDALSDRFLRYNPAPAPFVLLCISGQVLNS
ncbi:hypothetical protein EVAR_79312_1 [Eumeta japonica]|uniref:Uncharacterized protein n=1 Tax=Eumeta variegata TaxID=151549 RepID=A0A4C1TFQ2_EUMVA|nr:hypothetical protein EVAR_79312_1 [Eumeta japonica]